MSPRRIEPLRSPVHLLVDGKRIAAREGEPVAVALAASGHLVLGRSVKYHRPRGAACYAGRCDGCLMRVDGAQSVMTCRTPAREGMSIETQNVIGSARRDLLAATDWFFPKGMNHHEMFTWNEQVNLVMQKVARRIAGVGTLPDVDAALRESPEVEVDVLVVGGGPAGLRASASCARAGLSTMLVEEDGALGGSLVHWPAPVALEGWRGEGAELAGRMIDEAVQAGVRVHARASAVAVYDPWEDAAGAGDPAGLPALGQQRRSARPVVAVDEPEQLLRVHPRRLVVAMGRHEGAAAFGGNDKPGVVGARAACVLLAHGVLLGERVILAGEGAALDALAGALRGAGAEVLGPLPERALLRARGRPSVSSCDVELEDVVERHECDALVVAPPTSAVFELAAQAGVPVRWHGESFEIDNDPEHGGTTAPDVRVVGAAAGVMELDRALAQAERAAAAIVEELAGP